MKKTILLFVFLMTILMSANAQIVFQENFNSTADGALPTGWTRFNVDGLTPYTSANLSLSWVTDAWVCKLYGGIATKAAWSTSYYAPAGTANDWMFTPAIVIPATYPVLQFTELAQDPSYPDGYELRISTVAPATGNLMSSTIISTVAAASNPAVVKSINLSAYAGQTVYIGWRNKSVDMFTLGIDDIVVKSLPANSTAIVSMPLPVYLQTAVSQTIGGVLRNNGGITVTSLKLNYSINGGTAVTQNLTGLSIPMLTNYSYAHSTNWTTPSTAGTFTIKLWASDINGNVSLLSDTITKVVTTLSTIPTKRVIIGEATGAWCQYCPDGAVKLQQVLAANPKAIGIALHNGDGMTTPESDAVNTAFISGFPSGLIDMYKFNSESTVEINRTLWAGKTTERLAMVTPVSVSGNNTYNSTTREVIVNVSATFYAGLTGEYRFNSYIVEDSVSGTGSGYNQVNAYNATVGHPMYGLGNPIIGYQHRDVLRKMIGGSWGSAGSIPATIVANTPYTFTYNYTLPAGFKANDIEVVVLVQKYSTDINDREILNANKMELNGVTGIVDVISDKDLTVYPNPASDAVNIKYSLNTENKVKINIYNVLGELVCSVDKGKIAAGNYTTYIDISSLSKGFYIVKLEIGNNVIAKKISVK